MMRFIYSLFIFLFLLLSSFSVFAQNVDITAKVPSKEEKGKFTPAGSGGSYIPPNYTPDQPFTDIPDQPLVPQIPSIPSELETPSFFPPVKSPPILKIEDWEIKEEQPFIFPQKEIVSEPEIENLFYPVSPASSPIDPMRLAALFGLGASILAASIYLLKGAPFLIFPLRAKSFGIVYDSKTKKPILNVEIILQNKQNLKKYKVLSDKNGGYSFKVKPGIYQLMTKNAKYSFPSKKMVGHYKDGKYQNLYNGQWFEIVKKGQKLKADIPLDPLKKVTEGLNPSVNVKR